MLAWEVLRRCGGQIRMGEGGPYALDFTAILTMAAAMGIGTAFLAEILPSVEVVMIEAYRQKADDAD
ncbi:hypothetical protein MMB17_18555 [Methylobacterium organophilum]|uniref:DUF7697 family protein n=1 Tax=Methylobacterium organophilum TaxID=410 RepID=UPI001F1494D8|nr:hypothetical protein [Methylobacterium organophilum]UMY16664.1 hypothetical protein MMB17_18555 [Methylobacterium organophilum]